MKYSKFVHIFDIEENVIALYHSLLIKTIFLNKEEFDSVRLYLKDNVFINNEVKDVVKYLFENYFIVNSVEEDNNLYYECTKLINTSAIANVYIVTTENCNFNCKYCFISEAVNSNNRNKIMNEKVAMATVSLLQKTYEADKAKSDKIITFYGGEPLLNFKIIKVIMREIEETQKTKYWPDNVKFSIITNGSLLTEEIIDFLKKYKISLGISFDGTKATSANRIGRYSTDSIVDIVKEKIELCQQKEMPFTLSITISEDVIKHQNKVLAEILSLEPTDISFNLLIPSKEQTQNFVYYEEATDFIINAFKLFRKKGIHEDRIMRKVQAFTNTNLYFYDCCASGGNQYVISPIGEIGICHGYLNNKKYFSSNVFDENFNHKTNPDFQYWQKRTPLLMEKCLDCECLGICGGGCPYAAEYAYGSIYDLDKRFCIHSKKILKWLVNDLYKNMKINKIS
jgi:uncharacterized protein